MANKTNQEIHPPTLHPQPPFEGEKVQKAPGLEAEMSLKPDFGEQSYQGHGRLNNMVALVTGGDSGIGRAVCLAFAREGAKHIMINYLDSEQQDADETKRVVEACGTKCTLIPKDLHDEAGCKAVATAAVAAAASSGGHIDILVNNAAYQGPQIESIEQLTGDRLINTFNVNILAMFHLTRFLLKHMSKGGSIINVSSVEAYQPHHFILDYATTKGAILSFTKGLAQDPGVISRGIRANCVCPGPVWTPLIVQSLHKEVKQFGKELSPMKRPAQPVELSPAFVFLAATKESSFVNGEALSVTGGMFVS